MEENDKIDDLFRKKMMEGESHVPLGAWDSIKQQVDSAQMSQGSRRKRILPFPLVWMAASFLTGVALSSIGYYLYDLKRENIALHKWIEYKEREGLNVPQESLSGVNSGLEAMPFEEPDLQQGSFSGMNHGPQGQVAQERYEGRANVKENGAMSPNKDLSTTRSTSTENNPHTGTASYPNFTKKGSYKQVFNHEENKNRSIGVKSGPWMKEERSSSSDRENDYKNKKDVNKPIGDFSEKAVDEIEENNDLMLKRTNQTEQIALLNQTTKPKDSVSIKTDTVIKIVREEVPAVERKPKDAKLFGFPIAVGVYLSPEVASRSIHFSEKADPRLVDYKENDKNKFGFSAGLSLDLQLPKGFFFRTGINYWNVGDKNSVVLTGSKKDTIVSTSSVAIPNGVGKSLDSAMKVETGFNQPSSIVTGPNGSKYLTSTSTQIRESLSQFASTVNNNYHYVGIPVVLGMKLGRSKLSAGVFTGVIANVLLSPKTSLYYVYNDPEDPSKFIEERRELSRLSLVYWGGMDIDWKVNKFWTISLSPNIKYSMTSVYKETMSMKQLPYSFGIQLGARYTFGK